MHTSQRAEYSFISSRSVPQDCQMHVTSQIRNESLYLSWSEGPWRKTDSKKILDAEMFQFVETVIDALGAMSSTRVTS